MRIAFYVDGKNVLTTEDADSPYIPVIGSSVRIETVSYQVSEVMWETKRPNVLFIKLEKK